MLRDTTLLSSQIRPHDGIDYENLFPKRLRRVYAILYVDNLLEQTLKAHDRMWVPLNFDVLRQIIPKEHIGPIRQRLTSARVIETSDSYSKGENSLEYRFTPEYRNLRRAKLTTPMPLPKRLIRKCNKINGLFRVPQIRDFQNRHLARLRIDAEGASAFADRMDNPDFELWRVAELADCINNGLARINRIDDYGRVHTLATNLPKYLREYLTYESKHLVGIDLKNSQPLMAGILACHYSRDRHAARKIQKRKFSKTQTDPYHRRTPPPCEPIQPDLITYLEICQSGRFYEELAEKSGHTRDEVKEDVCYVFFGKKRNKIRRIIKEEYPTVYGMIEGLKEDDYRQAARVLQNVEASIFIGEICRKIAKDHKNTPFIMTIHDSILTTEDYLDYVKEVIFEVFSNLGVIPAFHLEDYRPDRLRESPHTLQKA